MIEARVQVSATPVALFVALMSYGTQHRHSSPKPTRIVKLLFSRGVRKPQSQQLARSKMCLLSAKRCAVMSPTQEAEADAQRAVESAAEALRREEAWERT